MKLIKETIEKFYPDKEDIEAIKACPVTLQEIKIELGLTYQTIWRKLYNQNRSYFSRIEVEKLEKITGIKFKIH